MAPAINHPKGHRPLPLLQCQVPRDNRSSFSRRRFEELRASPRSSEWLAVTRKAVVWRLEIHNWPRDHPRRDIISEELTREFTFSQGVRPGNCFPPAARRHKPPPPAALTLSCSGDTEDRFSSTHSDKCREVITV